MPWNAGQKSGDGGGGDGGGDVAAGHCPSLFFGFGYSLDPYGNSWPP